MLFAIGRGNPQSWPLAKSRPEATHAAAAHIILAMSPQLAAIAVGSEGKVVIQPDVHAGRANVSLCGGGLAVRCATGHAVELDVTRMLPLKFGDGRSR